MRRRPNALDAVGLANLRAAMRGHVERADVPGVVTLVARGNEISIDAAGVQSLDSPEPMREDTIFRIASLTKPIAAAAVIVLVDDGKLRLDERVDRFLPELANRRVLRSIDAQLDDTAPARRPIDVRDVMTSTFGFGSVMAMPGTYPIQKPIRDGRLGGDGMPHLAETPAPDEWLRRLGELPLMYQPGERFAYNTSCDLMGVLVARVAGTSFGAFLRERIFEPLGMNDTAFYVPAEKLDRFPTLYGFDDDTREFDVFDSARESEIREPPAFESGAGGLVSTAADYFAFCRMLCNDGAAPKGPLLTPESVRMMTSDRLTPSQREGADIFFEDHSSWGFGIAVNIRQTQPWMVPGRFGWDGGFGTSAYSDRANDFVGILLTQRLMTSP